MTGPGKKANGRDPGNGTDALEATRIGVILDRSGSMASCREATIAGFNQFLHSQRQEVKGGRALMSLTQFADRYEANFVGEPIENVPDIDTHSYVPRGMTALHDAIGRTVHDAKTWVRKHNWKERVLVLIITDGHENASKEYDLHAIRALIEGKEKEGWNFAYMGANQDSYAVGGAMGVRPDFTRNYAATDAGLRGSFAILAAKTSRYRAAAAKGMAASAFFDSPKREETDPDLGILLPHENKGPGGGPL